MAQLYSHRNGTPEAAPRIVRSPRCMEGSEWIHCAIIWGDWHSEHVEAMQVKENSADQCMAR